jgi:hypothetical protein
MKQFSIFFPVKVNVKVIITRQAFPIMMQITVLGFTITAIDENVTV